MTDTGQLRRGIQRAVDAWNAHDGAALGRGLTDDVVFTDMALGERFVGREAVAGYVERFARRFSSDYRFTLGDLVLGDGVSFAVEWTMTGTNDGADERTGLPATGRRFEVQGVDVGRLRDGRIAENRIFWSLADYLRQVGLRLTSAPGA